MMQIRIAMFDMLYNKRICLSAGMLDPKSSVGGLLGNWCRHVAWSRAVT